MEKLIELPYSYDAFDSIIDKETMEIHHSRHLNAYVTNYNNAVTDTKYAQMDIKDVIADINNVEDNIQMAVRNNGGGVVNHNLYFTQFGLDKPLNEGTFKTDIIDTFGSIENLISELKTAGATRFGSGWSWLVLNEGKLEVMSTPNQDNPLMSGKTPLLGIDVWEHAYYLKYQNKRPDYLTAIFDIIDWSVIEARYNESK